MNVSDLAPGRVIAFVYLWRREQLAGRVEGAKVRPCVVFDIDEETEPGSRIVGVVPITHTAPERAGDGLELPVETKRRLGLDEARSWVVVTEFDRFTWPGFDLRRTPDGRDSFGMLPARQIATLIRVLDERARRGDLATVERDD